MKKAILRESGMKAEVEILEDTSNEEWERYKVKVIKVLRPSPYYGSVPEGKVIDLSAQRQYRHYVDWELEVI